MAEPAAHRIAAVRASSPAARAGIRPGDELWAMNGEPVKDDIDYQFFSAMGELTLSVRRGGETGSVRIQKPPEAPLGLSFEGPLMKRIFRCRNRCVFCFEDQLPRGVRGSLREKDDDWRMSLLYGNFVTLTNLSEAEWARIAARKPSPLYVSVHATDPGVRARMLGIETQTGIMEDLQRLQRCGIRFHTQIVLCPGYNDRGNLERTLADLAGLEATLSVGIVPVGLTDHRQGLAELSPVEPGDAAEVLRTVAKWQQRMREARDANWVYAADEFYVLAGQEIPAIEAYDDLPQIENGIGMLSLLRDELEAAEAPQGEDAGRSVVIATGVTAAPYLRDWIAQRGLGTRVRVVPIVNRFFGARITVTGLLVGRDIADQLGRPGEDEVLISGCMIKADAPLFLDDMTVAELSRSLGRPVRIVGADGQALVDAILGRGGDVVAANGEMDGAAEAEEANRDLDAGKIDGTLNPGQANGALDAGAADGALSAEEANGALDAGQANGALNPGAENIALPPEDARADGLNPPPADPYGRRYPKKQR